MSGQQIGSFVGGIIGAYIGGPVGYGIGSAIGGAIGGAIDPTKIYGPRLTDAQTQTAMDGVPKAYGKGTFPCRGTLIWQDIVKEHKHTDDGKGSGQEQITYTYTRSYAIGVCKGPITGYKIIKRNGKVVFDARTDAELSALGYTAAQIAESRAAQAKFLRVCTFYYGVAEQTPDPTIVAVKGVGNVPGYSRTAYIVLTDDETLQGEVAQYEFVVANCGTRTEDYSSWKLLITGTSLDGDGPVMAQATATATPEFEGIAKSTGADIANGIPGQHGGVWCVVSDQSCRYCETSALDDWDSSAIPFATGYNAVTLVGGPSGWVVSANNGALSDGVMKAPLIPATFSEYTPDIVQDGSPAAPSEMEGLIASAYDGNNYLFNVLGTTAGNMCATPDLGDPVELVWKVIDNDVLRPFHDAARFDGKLYATSKKQFSTGRQQLVYSNDDGTTWEPPLVDIEGTATPQYQPYQLAAGTDLAGNPVLVCLCWGGEYFRTSLDDFAALHATGIGTDRDLINGMDGAFKGKMIVAAADRFYIVSGTNTTTSAKGNKCVVVSISDGAIAVSDPISLPIQAVRGIAAGDGRPGPGWTELPDAPGYFVNIQTGEVVGPPGTQISVCKPTLGEIVAAQCDKRNVTSRDVSELTDEVVGFRVASPSSPQKNIGALMPGYLFDQSEYDGVLHFPKRGGEDSFALTIDDLCERDGDLIQWERTQEPELLRKATVAYMDPDTTYTPTTQDWERRAATVKAEGEGTIELPIVGTKDWAKQVAHKSVKIAWGESDKCTFHTSIAQAKLVTAAVGTITDEQGTVHRVRIERIEDEGLKRMVEARRTRADLYESTLSGAAKPLPLFPGSDLRGPTDALLLNIPLLGDTDDVPGIYWAASGFLSGWAGGTLQIQRAGQWVDLGTITLPCAMGTLLSDLPTFAGDVDYTSTLHISMNDDLESVTFHNLLSERNPVAILNDDGTAEIVQFQTATEVAPGEYECTTLIRGRLDTTRSAHSTGARVVFLDNRVRFAKLKPEDLGKTLTLRAVSLGTDPDAAATVTYTLDTMESQREWQPYNATYEASGDDWNVAFIGRYRLGTDAFPIASTNFRGWRIDFTVGSTTKSRTTLTQDFTYTEAMQIADFGSAQTSFDSVTVTATNLYTNGDGAGNPGSGTTATLVEP